MKWISLNRTKIKVYGKKSKLVIKGIVEEHKAFLHNLFTNDINNLPPFKFSYNLRLKGNGHPIQDFFVYNFGEFFILDTQEKSKVVIDEFIKLKLSMQVFFEDVSEVMPHIFIYGNEVEKLIKEKFDISLNDFEFKQIENTIIAKNPIRNGEIGFDIFGDISVVKDILTEENKASDDEFEDIRIKNCIPKIYKELKEGYLPLETPIASFAISFNKGCYIGQEAIARIHFRGKPPRTLAKFELIDKPEEGEKIIKGDKKVGEITSVSPKTNMGLGYILRAMLQNNEIFKTMSGKKIKLLGECIINYP